MVGPMDEPKSRAESQAQTRERLLDAARESFARRGLRGASITDIARSAGFTKGAVYANFAGKEDLFLAVLDRHINDSVATDDEQPRNATAAFDPDWGLLALEALLYVVREKPELREQFAARYRRIDEANTADGDRTASTDQAVAWSALGEGLMLRHLIDPDHVDHARIERIFIALFGRTPDMGLTPTSSRSFVDHGATVVHRNAAEQATAFTAWSPTPS